MLLQIYNLLLNLAFFFLKGKLKKKYTNGFDERQGKIDKNKISHLVGKCFWINAVSVGEAQAAISFMKAARNEGFSCPFLLSTTTETGRKMAFDLAGNENLFTHIYAVWDKKEFVINALETLKPIAYATVETEIWPNILLECKKRKIKTILINGRISDRTWQKISHPPFLHIAGRVFSLFDVITCRDETDRKRLTSISVPADKIFVTGDSKIDELLRRKEERQESIENTRETILSYFPQDTNKLIIAGSTHSPEEEIVFGVFAKLKRLSNNGIRAKFISVPRHPERVGKVVGIAALNELSAIRLSEIEKTNSARNNLDVIVVDKIGVLFDFYGASDVAFVGGSFVDKGGQNILEPLVWGVPTCYGPHMEDFAEPASYFEKENVAHKVLDSDELYTKLVELLIENKATNILASDRYFTEHGGTSYKLARIIKPFLEV